MKKKGLSLNLKTILMVGLIAIAVLAAAAVISYRVYAASFVAHYKDRALSEAHTVAAMVDAGDVAAVRAAARDCFELAAGELGMDFDSYGEADWERYYEAFAPIEEMGEYRSLLTVLQTLARTSEAESVYVCNADLEYDFAMYLADGAVKTEACAPGVFDSPLIAEIRALIEAGNYDFPVYITNYEEYGWLCTAAAPVLDADGELLALAYVDLSMNDVMRQRGDFLRLLVSVLAVIAALLIALFSVFINRMIVGPVNVLSAAAGSFVKDREKHGEAGELSAISRLSIHTGDEIEQLADAIRQMEQEINDYIDNLTRVTAEKERIGAELDVANQIQADMLPCIFPAFPGRADLDIYASMNPAKEVGGDFYDFFLIDERRLALVMADVSGKGVPAALFMVIAKTLIKNQAMTGEPAEEVLAHVNNQLCEGNREGFFVTAWLGIFDTQTGDLDYANAGHNPPVVIRKDGRMEWLRGVSGLVLAAMEGMSYDPMQTTLLRGERLYLYTDGVTEAINTQEELFGEERLLAALSGSVGLDVCESICTVLMELNEFVGDADQFDDITMLEFEYRELE